MTLFNDRGRLWCDSYHKKKNPSRWARLHGRKTPGGDVWRNLAEDARRKRADWDEAADLENHGHDEGQKNANDEEKKPAKIREN